MLDGVELLQSPRLAALSQMIISKLLCLHFPPVASLTWCHCMPQQEYGCPLKKKENDTVGLIRLNHRGTVVSTLPLGNQLKLYIGLFLICKYLF